MTSAKMQLGPDWTPALRAACSERCADEFGDPPCWSLAGETRMGNTPGYIDPCTPCAGKMNMGWQPIATAPRDGTQVLLYVPRRIGDIVAQGANMTGTQWWARNMGDLKPTHWMPLPDAPEPTA